MSLLHEPFVRRLGACPSLLDVRTADGRIERRCVRVWTVVERRVGSIMRRSDPQLTRGGQASLRYKLGLRRPRPTGHTDTTSDKRRKCRLQPGGAL